MNKFVELERARAEGKKIGFTASTFDLLHAGHAAMLGEALAHCDYLVVGLLSDPTNDRPESKNKPVQSLFERYMEIQAISDIDWIIPFESEKDLEDMIKMIDPDIRFCGKEYEGTKHTGWNLCPIYYNKRKHDFSTSELRHRVYEAELKNKNN